MSDFIFEEIENVINRYIPKGIDPVLHVDRRKVMNDILCNLFTENKQFYNKMTIIYLAKNWNSILHARAQMLN